MAMSEREATALFDLLRRAYPTYPVEAGTADVYVAALMRDRHDAGVAASAVRTWVVNESWMPKVNELLDAIKVEAATRNAGDPYVHALPAGVQAVAPDQHSRIYARLSAQVKAEMPIPEHRHQQGVENCPACALRVNGSYATEFAARLDELLAKHADELRVVDDPVETFACPQCLDSGFIEDGAVDGVWRPCPCRPETYDRWREGHFLPGHSCAACEAMKKGKRSA